MEMILVFLGLSSFTITGTDDLLVLILFYIKYQNKFKEVIIGTLLGLLSVMVPSYLFARSLSLFDVVSYIRTDWVLAGVLAYVAYGLLKDAFSQNEDEELHDISGKTSFEVVLASGVTYFLNGLDDFVVYSGFYLKYETVYENFFFSLGIIFGVFVFAMIAQHAGKLFLAIEEKYQNKIKVGIGCIVLLAASFVLIFGKVVNIHYLFFDKKTNIYMMNSYFIFNHQVVRVIGHGVNEIKFPTNFSPMEVSKMGELYYESLPKSLRLNEFFKIFVQHYVDKINAIIQRDLSEKADDLYDEVLVFQVNNEQIDKLNYPIFTLVSRDESEGFEYMSDANRITKLFKQNYFGKNKDTIFNTPLLLENAPGTEFDIMVVIDAGYVVFLNKKRAIVKQSELNIYHDLIQDMIAGMREKVISLL